MQVGITVINAYNLIDGVDGLAGTIVIITLTALAIANARMAATLVDHERVRRELELAAEIQQRLLPETMPQIPGFEVVGWNRPARVVGGDYFTFRDLGERGWAIVVGDVSGKGSPVVGCSTVTSTGFSSSVWISIASLPVVSGKASPHKGSVSQAARTR